MGIIAAADLKIVGHGAINYKQNSNAGPFAIHLSVCAGRGDMATGNCLWMECRDDCP